VSKQNIAGLAIAFALGACAVPAGPPPILSLDDRVCAVQPELISAPLLVMNEAARVVLDGSSACWQRPEEGKSAYTVFQLPQTAEPYIVTVTSEPLGQGLFLPQVIILNPLGVTLRTVQSDSFQFHNSALSVGIRIHRDEGYLIVASNPQAVGRMVSRITDATAVSGGRIQIHTGSETVDNYVYAHNGALVVTARPLPRVN
jgi:hypothetical protein